MAERFDWSQVPHDPTPTDAEGRICVYAYLTGAGTERRWCIPALEVEGVAPDFLTHAQQYYEVFRQVPSAVFIGESAFPKECRS